MNSHLVLQHGLRDYVVQNFPIRNLVDSLASRIHANVICFCQIRHSHKGRAGATDVSNFLRAFFVGLLEFRILWSMKQIPGNFRALSN